MGRCTFTPRQLARRIKKTGERIILEDKTMSTWDKTAKDLAESHVEWFLEIIRPLLIEHMIHGFKHGMEYGEDENE